MAVYCNGHHMTDSYYTYSFAEIVKRIWWAKSVIKQINGFFAKNQKYQFFLTNLLQNTGMLQMAVNAAALLGAQSSVR